MGKKTTVDLTPKALRIKDALKEVYGLRNILSAGLMVLNKLSSDDLQTIIAEANGKPISLDIYRDRLALLGLKGLIDRMAGYRAGGEYQIPPTLIEALINTAEAMDKLAAPTPSAWRVEFADEAYEVHYELVSKDEQDWLNQFRREQSEAAAIDIADGAQGDAEVMRRKKGRHTA